MAFSYHQYFTKLQAIDDATAFVDYMKSTPLENVEVWWNPDESYHHLLTEEGERQPRGWYYWYCLPGCLSNDYPHGPHLTEQAATIAAYVEQYEQEVI